MKKRINVIIAVISSLLAIIGGGVFVFTRRAYIIYGNITFDQILYHLSLPKDVINPGIIASFFYFGWLTRGIILCIVLFSVVNILICFKAIQKRIRYCYVFHIFGTIVSVIYFIASLLWCNYRFNIIESFQSLHQESELIDSEYVRNEVEDFKQVNKDGEELSAGEKPNLVLIISESMESDFANENVWGENLIPELSNLRDEGDFVEKLFQINGCHYTIASMYSFLYGLPLLYMHCSTGDPLVGNVFKDRCISILDVLDKAGYEIVHLQGSNLKFSGKGSLFSCVPSAEVIGANEVSDKEYPERNYWGLWDRDLFDIAKHKVEKLSNNKKTFCMSIETVDTHNGLALPDGVTGRWGDTRDSISLQSKVIGDFISWLKEQNCWNNTVVVIFGDHCMMTSKIGSIDVDKNERYVYNCILHSQIKGDLKNRQAAIFDFAPTILEALGFVWKSHTFGIGHSLYSSENTILEKHGVNHWNSESRKKSKMYWYLINSR